MNSICSTRCCEKCGKTTPVFALITKQVYINGRVHSFHFCGASCAQAFYLDRLRRHQ